MAERRTFVKTLDGRQAVQYAYSPAEAVQLEFNGWRERVAAAPADVPAAETAVAPVAKKATAAAADKATATPESGK